MGYTKYSTDAESTTVTNDASSITPRSLNYVFNNRKGTESVWVLLKSLPLHRRLLVQITL
ncbi:short tail fibers protein [Klebsiella phage CPRSB]|nr:short tail fibers protein [Klebsiella phage CPRSB]